MNPNDLLDAIGNVDDALIQKAKQYRKPQKHVSPYWSALAACLMMAIVLPVAVMVLKNPQPTIPEETQKEPVTVSSQGFSFTKMEVSSQNCSWSTSEYETIEELYVTLLKVSATSALSNHSTETDADTCNGGNSGQPTSLDAPEQPESPDLETEQYTIRLTSSNGKVIEYTIKDQTLTDTSTMMTFVMTRKSANSLLTVIRTLNLHSMIQDIVWNIALLTKTDTPVLDEIPRGSISYQELLSLENDKVLDYIFTQFFCGGHTDLTGQVMMQLMTDLLYENELISYETKNGQEYFYHWLETAIALEEEYGTEWLKENRPHMAQALDLIQR